MNKKILIISFITPFILNAFELPEINFNLTEKKEIHSEIELICKFPDIPETHNVKSDDFKLFEIKLKDINECITNYFDNKLYLYKNEKNKHLKMQYKLDIEKSKGFLSIYNQKVQNYYDGVVFTSKNKYKIIKDPNRLKKGKSRMYIPEYAK